MYTVHHYPNLIVKQSVLQKLKISLQIYQRYIAARLQGNISYFILLTAFRPQ